MVSEPWNTPYGRMGLLSDPFGAAFAIIGPVPAS